MHYLIYQRAWKFWVLNYVFMISSVLFAHGCACVLDFDFFKSSPNFSFLNVFKFRHYFLFGVSWSFHDLPESFEFIQRYFTVIIKIDLIEKFFGRYLSKVRFPMRDCLSLIYLFRSINVEYCECFFNFLFTVSAQILYNIHKFSLTVHYK